MFDTFTTHALSNLWTFALAMSGGSLITLALYFPRETRVLRRFPMIGLLGIAVAILLGINGIFQLNRAGAPLAYATGWRFEYIFAGLSITFVLAWIWRNRGTIRTPNEREQLRVMVLAGIFSFGPLAFWLLIMVIFKTPFSPYLLLPLAIFPVLTGYTLQRYRMLTADYIFSRALQIGLMAVMVVIGYALLASGLGLILSPILPPGTPLITGLAFFLVALLFVPIRDRAQYMIDAVFFRGRRAYQERLQTFSGELTRVVDLPGILQILRRYVEETLSPSRLHIFVYDTLSDQYVAAPDISSQPTSDLRFPVTSDIVMHFGEKIFLICAG